MDAVSWGALFVWVVCCGCFGARVSRVAACVVAACRVFVGVAGRRPCLLRVVFSGVVWLVGAAFLWVWFSLFTGRFWCRVLGLELCLRLQQRGVRWEMVVFGGLCVWDGVCVGLELVSRFLFVLVVVFCFAGGGGFVALVCVCVTLFVLYGAWFVLSWAAVASARGVGNVSRPQVRI